jgi:hypothetical protein
MIPKPFNTINTFFLNFCCHCILFSVYYKTTIRKLKEILKMPEAIKFERVLSVFYGFLGAQTAGRRTGPKKVLF